MNKEELSATQALKLLQKYVAREDEFNIFKVLKTDNYEIRHSNFLAWLFNPNETHGLGTQFIKKFFEKIKNYNITNNITNPKESIPENLDFDNIKVKREYKNIDIFIESTNFVCVIENKYGTGEHNEQCERYKEIAEEYANKNKIYIYLDLDDIEFNKNENNKFEGYHLVTYKDNILPILKEIYSNSDKEEKTSQFDIIRQYINILESEYNLINGNNLKDICLILDKNKLKTTKDEKSLILTQIENRRWEIMDLIKQILLSSYSKTLISPNAIYEVGIKLNKHEIIFSNKDTKNNSEIKIKIDKKDVGFLVEEQDYNNLFYKKCDKMSEVKKQLKFLIKNNKEIKNILTSDQK